MAVSSKEIMSMRVSIEKGEDALAVISGHRQILTQDILKSTAPFIAGIADCQTHDEILEHMRSLKKDISVPSTSTLGLKLKAAIQTLERAEEAMSGPPIEELQASLDKELEEIERDHERLCTINSSELHFQRILLGFEEIYDQAEAAVEALDSSSGSGYKYRSIENYLNQPPLRRFAQKMNLSHRDVERWVKKAGKVMSIASCISKEEGGRRVYTSHPCDYPDTCKFIANYPSVFHAVAYAKNWREDSRAASAMLEERQDEIRDLRRQLNDRETAKLLKTEEQKFAFVREVFRDWIIFDPDVQEFFAESQPELVRTRKDEKARFDRELTAYKLLTAAQKILEQDVDALKFHKPIADHANESQMNYDRYREHKDFFEVDRCAPDPLAYHCEAARVMSRIRWFHANANRFMLRSLRRPENDDLNRSMNAFLHGGGPTDAEQAKVGLASTMGFDSFWRYGAYAKQFPNTDEHFFNKYSLSMILGLPNDRSIESTHTTPETELESC